MSDSPRIHAHPHSVHLEQAHTPIDAEDDEHDYESLPVGYGWGVNMMAGAMVRIGISFLRADCGMQRVSHHPRCARRLRRCRSPRHSG